MDHQAGELCELRGHTMLKRGDQEHFICIELNILDGSGKIRGREMLRFDHHDRPTLKCRGEIADFSSLAHAIHHSGKGDLGADPAGTRPGEPPGLRPRSATTWVRRGPVSSCRFTPGFSSVTEYPVGHP